jgi:hypothetical protein
MLPHNAYPLDPDSLRVQTGWDLLDYLASIGGDEFSVRVLSTNAAAVDHVSQSLDCVFLGKRVRECTVSFQHAANPREIEVWRFDSLGRSLLRRLMPSGILVADSTEDVWAEDLCVYRNGMLLLGTVTHEQHATLYVTAAEWEKWLRISDDDGQGTQA